MLNELLLSIGEAAMAFLAAITLVWAMGGSSVLFVVRVLFLNDDDPLADC